VISDTLLQLVCCPDCRGRLTADADALACGSCGRRFARGPGYLDLRPADAFTETTRYTDEALHADARHEMVSPPLLQAGVRQWMLRRMLALRPGERALDFGCGSGRSLVWNAGSGASLVGVDVAPYFAHEALEGTDLVLGDLRRLPFGDGVFDKGYALDVFEHLSREGLASVLAEMARVVRPGGRVFVYSHVRKNSPLARGLRAINALARGLERVGLIDLKRERLRKSDHLNPLADIPDLERTVGAAGFRIVQIRYYTPLVGAFIENVLMRMAEKALGRWTSRKRTRGDAPAPPPDSDAEARAARLAAKRHLARGGALLRTLQAVTALMTIDVRLFGRIRTGPFFALLERVPDASR